MGALKEKLNSSVELPLVINSKIILSFYAFLPVSLIVIFIDQVFLGHYLQNHLAHSPEDILILNFFFNLPHIVASFFSLFDKEYVHHYRKQIGFGVPVIIAAAFLVPYFFGEKVLILLMGLWTAKHVVYQQFAIAPLFCSGRTKLNTYWESIGLYLGVLVYAALYPDEIYFDLRKTLIYSTAILIFPFLYYTYKISKQAKNRLGSYYIWANAALITIAIAEFFMGYGFFSILGLRIAHDFTSFYFSSCHDTNRARAGNQNVLYRFFSFLNLPVFILCPLIGIALAFPFNFDPMPTSALALLNILAMAHYYLDSVEWKKDSIHRKYVYIRKA